MSTITIKGNTYAVTIPSEDTDWHCIEYQKMPGVTRRYIYGSQASINAELNNNDRYSIEHYSAEEVAIDLAASEEDQNLPSEMRNHPEGGWFSRVGDDGSGYVSTSWEDAVMHLLEDDIGIATIWDIERTVAEIDSGMENSKWIISSLEEIDVLLYTPEEEEDEE